MASKEGNRQVLLALSGGGYRAMLFHVGALYRLNELGELSKTTHVSSVSGGSIVAGVLAANWQKLEFDKDGIGRRFFEKVVKPLISLASETIDVKAILGLLLFFPGARTLEYFYSKRLFDDMALADIPSSPRFIFNATNVQTGAIWSFQKDLMGDQTVGVRKPDVSLAKAVAASSAFPPFLAPLRLSFPNTEWTSYPRGSDSTRYYDNLSLPVNKIPDDELDKFRKRVVLADGGIADNLGLVGLPQTEGDLYISDGGARTSLRISPARNWFGQLIRTVSLIHDQPSRLRAFSAISRMADHDERRMGMEKTSRIRCGDGAYWHMHWPPESHVDVQFPELKEIEITKLSSIGTRLRALDDTTRKRLINWGYVAANRSLPYVARLFKKGDGSDFNEDSLPFPEAGFG